MADRRIGIIVNGASGELARRQHLPALLAIRAEGGLPLATGDRLVPDLVLLGRSAEKLKPLAAELGVMRWSTDLDAALTDRDNTLFFDCAATGDRPARAHRALAARKHLYLEKPIAEELHAALDLARAARAAGVKAGTVQDKLFLPGFGALRDIARAGTLGRLLEIRLEMGRWIFDGTGRPGQRPSWNYRKADGGGLILDMFPHWRYMLGHIIGDPLAVSATRRTHIARRIDEAGTPYDVDVEDSVFAQLEFAGGAIASVNSSWCTRPRRDGGIQIQLDGEKGSAIGTPYACWVQMEQDTPGGQISSAIRNAPSLFDNWRPAPLPDSPINSYRAGWELFLRHLAEDSPFPYTLLEGAKGVQFAEAAYRSDRERRWVELPPLDA